MSIALSHFQSSDLSRNPLKVFAAAEAGPLIVTRRDGRDLFLTSMENQVSTTRVDELAAQLLGATSSETGTLIERMCNVFPWMLALDENEKVQCTADLIENVRISLATGEPRLALAHFNGWRETATAIAEGLDKVPVDWLDEPIEVERP